jgi:hypothetical protein
LDYANIILDETAFGRDLADLMSHDRLAEVKACADDVFPKAAVSPRDNILIGLDDEAIRHQIALRQRFVIVPMPCSR